MPERLHRAVHDYFVPHGWPPRYDGSNRTSSYRTLLDADVTRFVFMPYAHRGDMSRSLNHWVANVQGIFAPHAIGLGAFHPTTTGSYRSWPTRRSVGTAAEGRKLHPIVGKFDMDDPRLDPGDHRAMEHRRDPAVTPVRQPEASEYVGARAFGRLMRRFPRLQRDRRACRRRRIRGLFRSVRALRRRVSGHRTGVQQPSGRTAAIGRVLEFQDRVLYGSDFPNIPHSVDDAVQAILNLRLGRTSKKSVFDERGPRAGPR